METDQHRWKKEIREALLALGICLSVYMVSYALNSFLGGYWLKPQIDGHDRYSSGPAIPTAFLWQPRWGHEAVGDSDFWGIFYRPLIRLDRYLVHSTIYLSDQDGFERIGNLPLSQVHPHWRDDYAARITTGLIRDGAKKQLRCEFWYSGSNNSREIVEIKMRRELARTLAVSPPRGFVQKPYEGGYQFLNTLYVHWVGRLLLKQNQNVTLEFPVRRPQAGRGSIVFYFQRVKDPADSRNFCSIDLR